MINTSKTVALALVLGATALPATAQDLRLITPVSGSGDALQELADSYSAQTEGVTVTVQKFTAGDVYGQALITQLQSGAGTDLMYTNGGYGVVESVLALGETGRLADLSGQGWAQDLPEASKESFVSDGKVYGLPLSVLAVGLIYNPDLMDQLGISFPKTEDAFFAACATARDQGLSFSSAAGPFPFYLIETIAASKVYADAPDWNARRAAGETSFAESQGWQDTFATYQRMAEEGCFQPGFEAAGISDLFAAFAGGQTVSGVGPITLTGAVMGMNPGIRLVVGPWPQGDDTVGIAIYNDALAVNAASPNMDAALAFTDWMAQPEQLRAYADIAGGIAPSDMEEGNFAENVAEVAPYYAEGRVLGLAHSGWAKPELRDALNRGGAQLVTGQATVDEVLAAMDAAWDN